MIYRLVKMLSGWYSTRVEDIEQDTKETQLFVDEGNIVAYTDDLEFFIMELGLSPDDIEEVVNKGENQ